MKTVNKMLAYYSYKYIMNKNTYFIYLFKGYNVHLNINWFWGFWKRDFNHVLEVPNHTRLLRMIKNNLDKAFENILRNKMTIILMSVFVLVSWWCCCFYVTMATRANLIMETLLSYARLGNQRRKFNLP